MSKYNYLDELMAATAEQNDAERLNNEELHAGDMQHGQDFPVSEPRFACLQSVESLIK